MAACASGGPSDPPSTPTPTPPAASGSDAPVPTDAPTDAPTDQPTDTPTDAPTDSPTTGPTDQPTNPAVPCTNGRNEAFFTDIAAAVAWPVYCAVLPSGWFVQSGSYMLAGGGRMEIGYRGPGDARLELSEGAFCGQPDGCVPAGVDSGETTFGDLSATLVALDDGGWAAVVERDASPSWLAIGSGLDEAAFRGLVEAFVLVGG